MNKKPPAGWYPDRAGGTRWWDGETWTEHTQVSPPPQQQLPPAGWHPDPRGSGGLRYWDGTRWTEHVAPTAATSAVEQSTRAVKEDSPADSSEASRSDGTTSEDDSWVKKHGVGSLIAALVVVLLAIVLLVPTEDTNDGQSGSSGDSTQKGGADSGSSGGSGERQLEGSWEVRIDPDRTVSLDLDGSFDVVEDTSEAAAGESDIWVETFGSITITNASDGRNIDGFGTGLELFVPIDTCPDWDFSSDEVGTHCSRDLVSFDIPDLDVGATEDVRLKGVQEVVSVRTEDVELVMDAMLNSSVVVSADRVHGSKYLDKLNPTCKAAGGIKWITYFTEDPDVTACATEPGG